jgi:aarF domain-containing kinase
VQVFERWLQPHIVLLDVGMATELRSQDRYNMLHLFKSFIEHNGAPWQPMH